MKWAISIAVLLFASNWHGKGLVASNSAHNLEETLHREKRDLGDITDIHSKLTLAARILSGISLRLGIHDGSVIGDKLISELLNLNESIKLDDMAKFDKSKIDKLFGDLEGLSLPSTNELDQLETKIETMSSLREQFESISNPDDKTEIDDYIAKIKAFNNSQIGFQFLIRFETDFGLTKPAMDILKDHSKAASYTSSLVQLKANLDFFADFPEKINTILDNLQNASVSLLDSKFLESPFVRGVELILDYLQITSRLIALNDNQIDQFVKNHNLVSGLSDDLQSVNPFLDIIQAIASFRTSKRYSKRFINGFSDVIKLSSDVQDTWIPTAIENYDKDLVTSELEPFKQFASSFKDLDSKWKTITNLETLRSMSLIRELFESVKNKIAKTAFTNFSDKSHPQTSDDFLKDVKNLLENIRNFRGFINKTISKLRNLKEMKEIKNIKTLVAFKEHLTFSGTDTEKANQLPGILAKMPSNDKLDELMNALTTIHTELTKTKNDPTELVNYIVSNQTKIQTFIDNPIKKQHIDYFKKLKGWSNELKTLSDSITLIRTIRKNKADPNFKSSLEGITQAVSSSISSFKKLREVPKSIKSKKTARINDLLALKGIEKDSDTFGEAVAVLNTVKTILSQKTYIDHLLEKGPDVDKALNDPTIQIPHRNKLKSRWEDFGKVSRYLGSLMENITAKTTSMTSATRIRRQLTSLKDYAGKLKDLNGLSDLEVDLNPVMDVLKEHNVTTDAPKMLKTLNALDKLDLKFSSHSSALNDPASVLSRISTLFGKIPKPSKQSAASKSVTEKESSMRIVFIGAVVGGIVLLGVAAGVGYSLYRKSSKKKNKKNVVELLDFSKLPQKIVKPALELKDCLQMKMEAERQNTEKDGPKGKEPLKTAGLDEKIETLQKKLGAKTAASVEKTAKEEYDSNAQLLLDAQTRFEKNKNFDEAEFTNKIVARFNKLAMTPLEMCRDKKVWKTDSFKVFTPPSRPGKEYNDLLVDMLTLFDPQSKCIIDNPYHSVLLNPFSVRIIEAIKVVDAGKGTMVTVNRSFGFQFDNVFCYEDSRVKLGNGMPVNASIFKTPYGLEYIICAAMGKYNEENWVDELIWERKPAFTVTIECRAFYQSCPRSTKPTNQYVPEEETCFYKCKYYVINRREIKVSRGEKTHTTIDYRLAFDKEKFPKTFKGAKLFPKDKEFRDGVKKLLREVTRKQGKSVIYFDEEGFHYACMFAGTEIIASSLSNDGLAVADTTTQLVKLFNVRGRMITQPDHAMLMIYMAVDMYLEDQKQEVKTDQWWVSVEDCENQLIDYEMCVEKLGKKGADELKNSIKYENSQKDNCEDPTKIGGTKHSAKQTSKTVFEDLRAALNAPRAEENKNNDDAKTKTEERM